MHNSQEFRSQSESPYRIRTADVREILLHLFPQHGELINKLDDDLIVLVKDLWLSPQLENHIPFPVLLACREQTLILLKKYISEFLVLTNHQLPLQLFLDSPDAIQQLCLEDVYSCIELYHIVNQNWPEIFNLSENLLANVLTSIHLKTAKPLNMMHCITIAKNFMHILKDKPQEKMQLILSQGDAIQNFCETNQLNLETFLNLPSPIISFLVGVKDYWKIFFRHIPFESWPQDIPVNEKILENFTYLMHPDCHLLNIHQKIIPLHILANADRNQVLIIMQNLPKVIKQLTDFDWTLEQLLSLDELKFKLFINFKVRKLEFIAENSPVCQFQKQFLVHSIFQNLSISTLSTIFQHPESAYYLFGQPLDSTRSPVLTLADLEPTIKMFQRLPAIYHRELKELQGQLACGVSTESEELLKKQISHIEEKIQALRTFPNLSEILFIEVGTILSLHYIKINIKELLSNYPLLVLDFLKHVDALLRFSNPKVNIHQEILVSLPDDKRKLFLEYSEQIVELIIEKHCNRDDLLSSSTPDILSRIKSLP